MGPIDSIRGQGFRGHCRRCSSIHAVSFPVFPWLVFPLVGMVLGDRLRNAADPKSGIRRAGLVGLALLVLGLGISFTDPEWHFNDYYHARWGSMIFMVGFVLAWLAACDLVVRGMPDNPVFRFLAFCSKRVTAIYFLQWILINWAIAILGESSLGLAGAVVLFLAVTGLSSAGTAALARFKGASPAREAGTAVDGGAKVLPPRLRDVGPDRETRDAAVRVLVEAFRDDPLIRYFMPGEADRRERLPALFEYLVDIELDSCHVSSPAVEGVAIWTGPGRHRASLGLRGILRGFELMARCGPRAVFRMLRYLSWSTRLRHGLVRGSYWHLYLLAVDPARRGQGHASALVKPFLAAASAAGERVYLETQKDSNVALYGHLGFKTLHSLPFGKSGVIHHVMALDPGPDPSPTPR